MKKIMIVACAVAFAAVARAATISWGGDICLQDCATPLSSGSTAYLITSATAFADPTKVTMSGSGFSDWTVDNGASVVASYSITDANIANWSFKTQYTKAGEGINGYFGVIVIDGNSAADGLTGAYAYLGNVSLGATDPAKDLLYGDGSFTNWIGENGYASVTFSGAAVPEPTSGLLLLLGMAGLALKRKRA